MIEPMRRVRITAVWGGTAYPLYTGFADDWVPDYQGNYWTYTTLTATDATKAWAAADRTEVAPLGAGELTGARVHRILNSADWPLVDRLIDDGDTTVQATDLAGGALTELQLVQDTELGELFVDPSGRAVFQGRASVLTRPQSLDSQATFGDARWFPPVAYKFSAGVAYFFGTGCTVSQSTAFAFPDPDSLLMTVTGSPTQAYVRPVAPIPIEEGRDYTATMWVYRPVAGNVIAAIDWFDDQGIYLDGVYPSFAVPAATWTQITVTGTAIAGTAGVKFGPTMSGSPPNGTQLYLNAPVIQATTPELPYADVKLTSLDDHLANRVTITRVGGTPQVVEDTTSILNYLIKGYAPGELLMETDGEALSRAQALLYRHKDPVRRYARLEFQRPELGVEAVLWPQLLGRAFGDRITIIRRPAGGGDPIERDAFIRGVEMSSDGQRWDSAWTLQAADQFSYFTIGHPVRGRIGSNPIAF